MCHKLFNCLINQTSSAWDKDFWKDWSAVMLIQLCTRSPQYLHISQTLKLLFSSACSLVCITGFSACLSPSVCSLPPSLSVYWPLLSVCLLICLPRLSLLSGSSQFSSLHQRTFFLGPHLFSAQDQPIYKSPSTIAGADVFARVRRRASFLN